MADQLSNELQSLRIARDAPPPRRERSWKWLRWAVPAAAVVALLVFVVYPALSRKVFKTEVDTTEIIQSSPNRAVVDLTASGYVVPQRVSKVGAKITGRIARVYIGEGDSVKEGDLLAELEDAQERSAIAVAEAQLRAAEAQLEEVEQQTERQRLLAEEGIAPVATLEDLQARLDSLRASRDAAHASLEGMRTNLSYMKIVSPISGVVIDKPAEPGELVGVMADSIAEIADMSSLMVEVDVPERRISQVVIGNPCEVVLDAYSDRRLRCKVHEIGRRVDRAKATVTVKVEFEEIPEEALPDMSARVGFLSKELPKETMDRADELVVRKSAVVGEPGSLAVFVIRDGKASRVGITVGNEDRGEYYRVVDGPVAGTRIVDNPPPGLSDGNPIKEKR